MASPAKPKFKSVTKKRPLRTRRDSDDETAEGDKDDKQEESVLQDTLELQKLRKRPKGVNVAALALGKKVSKDSASSDTDPFKIKSVGLMTLEEAKRAEKQEEANDGGTGEGSDAIGTQFSKETRVRDEDEEMRRFIEMEMDKRRRGSGRPGPDDPSEAQNTYMSPEDAALSSLPAHLKSSMSKKSEEMLSSQMLSGIPEVDLGIDEKIRNIEATEAAKKRAAEERIRKAKSGAPSEFVPTNLAVNFRHANRFKQTDSKPATDVDKSATAEPLVKQRTVVVGQVPQERLVAVDGQAARDNDPNRATDDLHLTQFKKHFQRK